MAEVHGVLCVPVCVSSKNRTPTLLVRQLAKETNSSPHHQDRPASPILDTPHAAHKHVRSHTHAPNAHMHALTAYVQSMHATTPKGPKVN